MVKALSCSSGRLDSVYYTDEVFLVTATRSLRVWLEMLKAKSRYSLGDYMRKAHPGRDVSLGA